ncbi:MAG TPA: hypothetical protein VLD67_02350, partial [Vicinamibacterales bacterium]|nr:hypothetical protein [Vicinamibacterales bacterium]
MSKAALYLAGVLPGVLSVMAIHTSLYGSPLRSGYGSTSDLYALVNAPTNVNRYLTWLVETETPVVFFAVVALAAAWRSCRRDWVLLVTALYVAVVWLCYAFYRTFNDWSFLRFLLPAFPAMLALVAAGLLRSLTWLRSWLRTPAVVLILLPFLAFRIGRPINLGIFSVWQVERRYVDTGTYVRLNMPENAVFLSMHQSGSLRYYA